jgi:MiaB-like tRNA modifying enzyme
MVSLGGKKSINLKGSNRPKLLFPRRRRNPFVGIVEISSGCQGECTFCQVKLAKGELRSYQPELIGDEIENALNEGCGEIWLTSQDNGCYGLDTGINLPFLLDHILKINKDFKLRLGMMNPKYARINLDHLLVNYQDERFFKFLHLPLQSGSNSVLKSMKRNHSVEDFTESVKRFRSEFPKSTLSTDIIVGYPTESEEDFNQTIKVIQETRPDIVNLSKYGSRPGTESESLAQFNPQILRKRSKLIHQVVRESVLCNNRSWIGWQGYMIVDEEIERAVLGRNLAYKPIILKESKPLGTTLRIKVIDATPACLIGEIT